MKPYWPTILLIFALALLAAVLAHLAGCRLNPQTPPRNPAHAAPASP